MRDDGSLIVICDVFNVNQTESNIKLFSSNFKSFQIAKERDEKTKLKWK